jgi:hypothetical protein
MVKILMLFDFQSFSDRISRGNVRNTLDRHLGQFQLDPATPARHENRADGFGNCR